MPDLDEILALPQDEMTDIVQRFLRQPVAWRAAATAAGTRRFSRNGSRRSATLDFDKLTRNAQVDYLYIKKRAELDRPRAV